MGQVDFEDDNSRRYVIRHYRYDPARRERRHVVVAVVDSRREYNRLFEEHARALEQRRQAGEGVDPREHISGHVMEPGHLARAANGHLVRRAIEHGVWPERLREVELPSNMALFSAEG